MSRPPVHGGHTFLARGVIGRGKRKLAAAVDAVIREYRADLGGDITTGQDVLLAQLRKCLLFMALVDQWLGKQKEFVNKAGDIPPALSKFYLSALAQSCRICRELGLDRKTEGESLEKYLQGRARQAHGAQPGKPSTIEAAPPEKSPHSATSQGIPGGEA